MQHRPRRNRQSASIRAMVRETHLMPESLILPIFVREGDGPADPIDSMSGVGRHSIEGMIALAGEAFGLGLRGVALFPKVDASLKTPDATEALNPNGLVPRAVRALKAALPEMVVITDVALDPYNRDGHDGLWIRGEVDNDATLPLLARMAVLQAEAGADVVAPSDMMDGRIGAIREALDAAGHTRTLICSYAMKYASAFYGPFRDALDSAPGVGDKRGYQADPANAREALREVRLDEEQGADWILVKPGLPYLDIVRLVAENTTLPVAAYHVSGEYAMLRAAAERGWIDYDACLLESLLAFRRAGARLVLTYGAMDAARLL